MKRTIVYIDPHKCNGCGACANACHEGAIGIVDGKAVLLRDDYCDGLGDCLPACPTGAISFEEREAAEYNEAAVLAHKAEKAAAAAATPAAEPVSRLANWPVQIKLAPVRAPYYAGADLLIAADCTAFAYAGIHDRYINGRVTLIGCPKLDAINYAEKLGAILAGNAVASVTVLRMEVPCCGGLEFAVKNAIAASGKDIPLTVTIISTEGEILKTY